MTNPESELTSEEQLLLRRVGVRPGTRKPLSLWATQILFAVHAVLFCLLGVRSLLVHPAKALFALTLSGGLLVLIVAVQRRRAWSHFAVSAALALLCVTSIVSQFHEGSSQAITVRPEERSGAAVGSVVVSLVYGVLCARVLFGNSARQYLKNSSGGAEY